MKSEKAYRDEKMSRKGFSKTSKHECASQVKSNCLSIVECSPLTPCWRNRGHVLDLLSDCESLIRQGQGERYELNLLNLVVQLNKFRC